MTFDVWDITKEMKIRSTNRDQLTMSRFLNEEETGPN